MNTATSTVDNTWYKNFWVWVIIALPASAVIACGITIWLVLQAPDPVISKETTTEAVNDVVGRNSVAPPKR